MPNVKFYCQNFVQIFVDKLIFWCILNAIKLIILKFFSMFTFMYLREKFNIPQYIKLSWGLIESNYKPRLVLILHGSKVYLDIAYRRFYGCRNVEILPAKRTRLSKDAYLFSATKQDGKVLDRLVPTTYLRDVMYASSYSPDLEENPTL